MREILRKEMTLSALPLSYLFIAFGAMFLLPGYPILCGAFFVTLGIFQSFRHAREADDIGFSLLLPIERNAIVRGKYLFVCLFELAGFMLMAIATVLRMTVLSQAVAYRENALMAANPFALGLALTIFALFNLVFLGGFFKTAYDFTKPFIGYMIAAFVTIGIAETLHHLPGLALLNAMAGDHIVLQLALLAAGILVFMALTCVSFRKACDNFNRIDF